MTAEIAIMNKSAVALASDSAVTLRSDSATASKIYNTANKLFTLSKYAPVGVMIYGSAELLGVPWETIIKTYRSKLGEREFPTLRGYVDDFVRFIGESESVFSKEKRVEYADAKWRSAFLYILGEIDEAVKNAIARDSEISAGRVGHIVTAQVRELHRVLSGAKTLQCMSAYPMNTVVEANRLRVEGIIAEVFEKLPLSSLSRRRLHEIAALTFLKRHFPTRYSGLVVAGFGTEDIYPRLYETCMDGVLLTQARHDDLDVGFREISDSNTACIAPFAQSEMVATFMEGVDPHYQKYVETFMRGILEGYAQEIVKNIPGLKKKGREILRSELLSTVPAFMGRFERAMHSFRQTKRVGPVIGTVGSLPKDELAAMAEALVNLTSFKRRVSSEEETVGGPIDVAVISKGDGFIWIRRKHYFVSDLNPHFFRNYYRGNSPSSAEEEGVYAKESDKGLSDLQRLPEGVPAEEELEKE